MRSGIHLRNLLLVVISGGFVTLLIVFTGEIGTYWPLYLVPVILAAITYHVPGAVVTSATIVAVMGLLVIELDTPLSGITGQLFIGMVVFAATGIAVGEYTRRLKASHSRLESCSVTDPLTGVYTQECFEARLGEETRRADRYGMDIGLVLLKVDGLDEFRETFGHHRGNLLLSHLAEVVRIAIRDTDVLARYGDGFAFILPFATIGDARAAADRIRGIVTETEFEGDELEPVTSHTLSLGVSVYPALSRSKEALLAHAEKGLSEAIEAGGDRVGVSVLSSIDVDAAPSAQAAQSGQSRP